MKINNIHIRNFRKLKNSRIAFDEQQTIFVGANNSGKTSAMSAIVWFLKYKDKFTTREFTLTNWTEINKIGDSWCVEGDIDVSKLSIALWDELVPSLDVWISVEEAESYLVYKLLPSLDWKKDMVGVRLRFEPKDVNALYAAYREEYSKVSQLKASDAYKETPNLKLYPETLRDFLESKDNLNRYFEVKYYVLDSEKIDADNPDEVVQPTPDIAQDENVLSELIHIDSIEAYRDFADPEGKNENDIDTLSKQLQAYYRRSNKEEDDIKPEDLKLMDDLMTASKTFDNKINKSFASPIAELNKINYPGFQNPDIIVKSYINIVDSISHESSVQFAIKGTKDLTLPEKYNGLGLRNLISMYLKLVQFRELWTHPESKEDSQVKPIHLVFIEEPEAHLHAQAQQVFIRKALDALTNAEDNEVLRENPQLVTQLVITTHSNHIVNEVDMNSLRYFRRIMDEKISIPVSTVINLSGTFGDGEADTKRFVSRYIRLTHCDIFFADAVILVEGTAERILMPKFLKNETMDNHYVSVIEINGSHAHRFSSLLKKLSIPTLIVTDLDAQGDVEGEVQSMRTQKGIGQTTNNDTIKYWLGEENIDALIDLKPEEKIKENVRIAYQTQIEVSWKDDEDRKVVYPYTFEDAVVFSNPQIFADEKLVKGKGPVTTFYNYRKKAESIEIFHNRLFECLHKYSRVKAEFANVLMLDDDFETIITPMYIVEGLKWLKIVLDTQKNFENGK